MPHNEESKLNPTQEVEEAGLMSILKDVPDSPPKTPKTMGRPKAIDDLVLRKLLYAFRMDMTDEQACEYSGIAPSTLYKYQSENPDFSEEKEHLKNFPFMLAKRSVFKGIETDPHLALRWLKARDPKNYATSSHKDGSQGPIVIIQPVILGELDPLRHAAKAYEQSNTIKPGEDIL